MKIGDPISIPCLQGKIVGLFIHKFKNSVIIYQPNNRGAFVMCALDAEKPPFVGDLRDALDEAEAYDKKDST